MRKTRLLLFILLIQVSVGIRAQDIILTTEGLGPVKLGALLDNIPDTYPGLYASKGMERDETVFFDENNQEVFRAFVGEDKIVNLIAVVSPNILTPEGAHVGMKKAEIARIAGAIYIQPDPYADFPRDSYDLFGITLLMDWEDQGVVTEMTVTNIPDDFDQGIENEEQVHQNVKKIFKRTRRFRDILQLLMELRRLDHVSNVYAQGNNIYMDIEGFGTVSYSHDPDQDLNNMEELLKELRRIEGPFPNRSKYNDAVIAFQMENDDYFSKEMKSLKESAAFMFENGGYNKVTFAEPTVNFFLNDLFNHTLVFLHTHGGFDGKRHWLATSEKITNKKLLLTKYKNSIKNNLISLRYECHETHDGVDISVPYVNVSENLIFMARNQFAFRAPVIVYNTACHSMEGSYSMAEAFREKGAYLYLGYNKEENVGLIGGLQFFGRLLSGMSVEGALKSLDKGVVENNLINTHGVPVTANLLFSPKTDTHQFEIFKDQVYVRPELLEAYKFYFSKEPVKYHGRDTNGKDIVGVDQLIHLQFTGRMPLNWFDYPSKQFNKAQNKAFGEIPLEYGFQLCKDNKFEKGTYATFVAPIGEPYVVNDVDNGYTYINVKSEYQNGIVTFTMSLNFPVNNIFWDKTKEQFFLRPVVYDRTTKKFTPGGIKRLYKTGGPSDPNLKNKR